MNKDRIWKSLFVWPLVLALVLAFIPLAGPVYGAEDSYLIYIDQM